MKLRLVAQGFLQESEIDYEEIYSPVINTTAFRYLISLAVSQNLEMRLMDVVTAYLYGGFRHKNSYENPGRISFT